MMEIQKLLGAGPAAPFAAEMLRDVRAMERNLRAAAAEGTALHAPLNRILSAGGKRLRPLLAWVCWHCAGGAGEIVPLMTMLELMHTSSLIHDDFVDGAASRRGAATINAREGAAMALRSGDYLLSAAMGYLKIYRGTGINEALSAVAQEMCLGELEQHAALFHPAETTRAAYFRRIERKTALLIAESCRAGAVAGGADSETAERLRAYGHHLGLAFQLRDDLMDWAADADSGKAPMQDARSGVVTLPQLLACAAAPEAVLPLLERRDKTEAELAELSALLRSTGALEASRSALQRETEAAAAALSALPECAEKTSLLLLAAAISEVNHCG